MPLRIREVERKLFSYLFLNKVAISSQIQRDIYRGISHQALYKRLNKLIGEKYIDANYHRELKGRLVYNLAPKALTDIVIETEAEKIRRQLKSNYILHDLDLVNIRAGLKSLNQVDAYFTENLIQSGAELEDDGIEDLRQFHFDAILRLKRGDRRILLPLEYERSLKASGRYRTYFQKIYSAAKVDALLYVTRNEEVLRKIQAFERSVIGERWPKAFYETLENLESKTGPVEFENLNRERITLE